jgi:hypothetical protein
MDRKCPYWSELDKHGVGCPFRDCKHNMYWEGLNIKNPTDTERFEEFKNCMLLLDESITLEDIGQAYGISRERVRQVEEGALTVVMKRLHFNPEKRQELKQYLQTDWNV